MFTSLFSFIFKRGGEILLLYFKEILFFHVFRVCMCVYLLKRTCFHRLALSYRFYASHISDDERQRISKQYIILSWFTTEQARSSKVEAKKDKNLFLHGRMNIKYFAHLSSYNLTIYIINSPFIDYLPSLIKIIINNNTHTRVFMSIKKKILIN